MGAVFWVTSGLSPCWLIVSDLTQGPHQYARAPSSQDGFQHEGLWEVGRTCHGLAPSPFWTPVESSCMCVVGEVPLTSRIKNVVILSFYSRAQLLCAPALSLPWGASKRHAPAVQPGFHLSRLKRIHFWFWCVDFVDLVCLLEVLSLASLFIDILDSSLI